MTAFIIAALLLTALVVALLTRPLYKLSAQADAPAVDAAALNAALLREELAAADADRAAGRLDDAGWTQARDDLARRLLDEQPATAPARAALPVRPLRTFAAIVLLLPLAAGVLYAGRGTPEALWPGAAAAAAAQADAPASPPPDISKMVASLAAKLEANPDNPKGWAMLGRSYAVMGRYADAVAAYGRVGPALETNATWLSEYADALAMQAGGNPVGKPEQVAARALRVDPDNLLALMMAGYGAAARQDFDAAVPLVERALQHVAQGSDDERFLKDLLAKVRARQVAGPAGGTTVAADAAAGPATAGATATPTAAADGAAPVAAAPTAISLSVDLSPSLRDAGRGKVLFVIARAPGQRMPIAVVRVLPDVWPVRVTLDADSTLDPRRPLASVPRVEVEARLSAGGTPQAGPGDLLGVTELPTGRTLAASLTIDHRRS